MVAISGLSGLFKLVTSKTNGLIVADPDTGKTKFCSIRQHQFTPMETVAIYTEEDTVDIKTVFTAMLDKADSLPMPLANAPHADLIKYFEVIIPDYDRDKVFHSDMKKIIKWFVYLNDRGYLTAPDPDENDKSATEIAAETLEVIEEAPKKKEKKAKAESKTEE